MKVFLPLLLPVLLLGCAASRDPEVTFRVEPATPLAVSDTVYLTGEGALLGNWQPRALPLRRHRDGSWRRSLRVAPGTALALKVTRGAWATEAVAPDGRVPGNTELRVRRDTTVVLPVAGWKDAAPQTAFQVTGTVRYHRGLIGGESLRPRDVVVWLPPSYDASPERRYPVLYAHDGQNLFDPATSFTGVDWQIDEVVDSLSRRGRMQEIIVVGVYNTPDRNAEYDDTPLGRAYRSFLVDSLKPLIDRTYRTLPGREHTAVMGSSMGGLAAFLAVWHHPDVFSMAACLSPAFINEAWVDSVRARPWNTDGLRLYIDNGGRGVDPRLQPGVDAMRALLPAKGFAEGRNLLYFRDEAADHNEAAWAARVWRPLLFFFGADR